MHITNLTQTSAVRAMRAIGTADTIGTAFSMSGIYPYTDSTADQAAADRCWGFTNDWFLRPIMKGEYPVSYVDMEAALKEADVRPGEVEALKEPLDFIGVNLYTRIIAADNPDEKYLGIRQVPGPGKRSHFGWEVWPPAIYRTLMRVDSEYGKPIYVTENGSSWPDELTSDGRVHDSDRIDCYSGYIGQVARAIDEGADVRGTTPGRCWTTSVGLGTASALAWSTSTSRTGSSASSRTAGTGTAT
jgi:beta-glucosidase